MSRKQWGHGYYTGKRDGECGGVKRYIAAITRMDKPHIRSVYRILKKNEDVMTVEDVTDYITLVFLSGNAKWLSFPAGEDEADLGSVSELRQEDLEKDYDVRYFSSEIALRAFVWEDMTRWYAERKEVSE